MEKRKGKMEELPQAKQLAIDRSDYQLAIRNRRGRRQRTAGFELEDTLATGGINDVQLAVARSHVDVVSRNDRRGIDARPRHEGPQRLAGLEVQRVEHLVAATDED